MTFKRLKAFYKIIYKRLLQRISIFFHFTSQICFGLKPSGWGCFPPVCLSGIFRVMVISRCLYCWSPHSITAQLSPPLCPPGPATPSYSLNNWDLQTRNMLWHRQHPICLTLWLELGLFDVQPSHGEKTRGILVDLVDPGINQEGCFISSSGNLCTWSDPFLIHSCHRSISRK